MDIIDIMLARAMTPQGQTETYVGIANAAASKAEKAEQDAAAAIALVESAAETITETQEAADTLLETAQELLETAQEAQINIPNTEDIDAEVKKLTVNTNVVNGVAANTLQVITTYPDNTLNTQNITKLYKNTGTNEDGTMTQKAITDALNVKADKTYVDSEISKVNHSGGNVIIEMDPADENHFVKIGSNGTLVPSLATEEAVIEALLRADTYIAEGAVGLDIDYANRAFTRTQGAIGKSMGNDFNSYTMYGGRTRCNVADDGTITAFYGDNNYKENGTNG